MITRRSNLIMLWEKITLSKDEIEAGQAGRICEAVEDLAAKNGRREDVALFIDLLPDPAGAFNVYFSPEAAEIASRIVEEHLSIPCNPPARVSVKVLLGKPSAMSLLTKAS